MKTYTITFTGTDEQLLAGAIENGYTGFKPVVIPEIFVPSVPEIVDGLPVLVPAPLPEPEEETVDEFICRILKTKSPHDFIMTAVVGLQNKKGTENYNGEAMKEAMLSLITIEPAE